MKAKCYGSQDPYVNKTALEWSFAGPSRLEGPSVAIKTFRAGSGSTKEKNLSLESASITNDSSSQVSANVIETVISVITFADEFSAAFEFRLSSFRISFGVQFQS